MTRLNTFAGWSSWAALLLMAMALSLVPSRARASPSITVSQPSATVETGRMTRLLLSAEGMPAGAHLHIDSDPGVVSQLHKEERTKWVLSVGPDPKLTTDGTLTVLMLDKKGRRLAFAQVKITPKALPSADSIEQAILMFDGGGLVEGRKSQGYLSITNKSEQAIAVRSIDVPSSDQIKASFRSTRALILPRETVVHPLTLEVAKGTVPRTGTHLVVLGVTLTTDLNKDEARRAGPAVGSGGWQAHILATKEIELTVPGVTELQGILQIPSLLLMPGLLAMIAFTAILEIAKPRPPGESVLSRLTVVLSPGLWVLMIIVSGAIGFTYALITKRDILYGFGVKDLVWLWFVSLILGGIAGAWAYVREKNRQRLAAAPRFANGITPADFLDQLVAEHEPLRRRVRVLGEQLMFDLGPGGGAKEMWACGAIGMYPLKRRDPQMFAAIRNALDDGKRLATIKDYAGQGKLALRWMPFNQDSIQITAPQIVSTDLLTGIIRDDTILREIA